MTQDTVVLEIVEVHVDDPAAVDATYNIGNAVTLADFPDLPPNCRYQHEMRLRVPWPADERHLFLAYRSGVPVGMANIDLPIHDNLDKAHIEVSVPAELRRQGIGTALFAHAAKFAAAKGRTSALGFGGIDMTGFAEAMGLSNGLVDVRRRLTLDQIDETGLDRLLAEGWSRAADYSTVQWGNIPPEELLTDLAALDSSFLEESPMGDLDYEPQQVNPERLRLMHETREQYGSRGYETGIIHTATGQLVAWSALRVAKTIDWHAWQNITLVHPKHRGHRLGVISKIENLRFLRANEPAVRVIDTWNAEVNEHMIAINEAMGFRAVERWADWQGPIS
jgi:GNAT superfamily N-acetyltransferase